MAQHTGKVAWFNNAKGFGFVSAEGMKDVFCHFTAILGDGYKSLNEGDTVAFDVVPGEKGPQAANVARLNDAGLPEGKPGPGRAGAMEASVGADAAA